MQYYKKDWREQIMNEEKVIFIYDETKENIESKILKLFKQFLELENT